MDKSNTFRIVAIVVTASILVYVLWDYGGRRRATGAEKFDDMVALTSQDAHLPSRHVRFESPIDASAPAGVSSHATEVDFPVERQMPESCYPRERLTAEDLLPKDAANSKWAQVNPAGQGDLRDKNFLTAGYHVGINTVGSSLRNPNMSMRSEPPNPQLKVSPWANSTITPDLMRKPLDDCL